MHLHVRPYFKNLKALYVYISPNRCTNANPTCTDDETKTSKLSYQSFNIHILDMSIASLDRHAPHPHIQIAHGVPVESPSGLNAKRYINKKDDAQCMPRTIMLRQVAVEKASPVVVR